MRGREFIPAAAGALSAARQKQESATAGATADKTPRVGIVLSNFKGSQDHDGTKIPGLADPRPVDADLTAAEIDAMVRKAIQIGNTRRGGLAGLIGREDWVVIKPNIVACHGLTPETKDGGAHHRYIPGTVADLRVVRSLIAWLVEHRCGARITIAEGSGEWLPRERSKSATDGWTTDWGGQFGGLSYAGMIAEFKKRRPSIEFDLVDLNFDATIEMPVPDGAFAKNNPRGTYILPATIQQCDKLISVGALKTHRLTGVSLALKNYFGIGPGSEYGFPKAGLHKLGDPDEVIADLFSFHPADYAILGGSWGVEGDGPYVPGAVTVRHNVIVAGASAVAVDAVGAAVMGFDPARIRHLKLAERRGFGGPDLGLIWTRGNTIQEARRVFRKPV